MLTVTKKETMNRRADARERTYEKAQYFGLDGVCHRTEIINLSFCGARITTKTNVNIGDKFHIINRLGSGLIIQKQVEVRWVSPLAGGHRQVAGVQIVNDRTRVLHVA